MTNPVILLGTQSNGETLPVQVDATGRLVAEGLQGIQGPEGPEGPQGPQGPPGQIDLPPDPYEGALLGWLNGGLAWVGSPPVPIPEGVFGPIVSWDPDSLYLEVEGEIPETVGTGVYVYQCSRDGVYFTEGWNTSQVWSNGFTSAMSSSQPATNAFDGNAATYAESTSNKINVIGTAYLDGSYLVEVKASGISSSITCNGSPLTFTGSGNLWRGVVTNPFPLEINHPGSPDLYYVKVEDEILVDTNRSLNMRVQQQLGNGLLGVPSAAVDFTVGQYLRVPAQRVAPWVLYGNDPSSLVDRPALYGNDPTSDIDHLRQTRD